MSESNKPTRGRGPNRRARRGAVDGQATGTPASQRELRAQGRRTMRKLLDAGMRVFAERGYHAARVDDIVRAARTSHGTFYLYFASKEDLLRALAVECAHEWNELAASIGPITPDDAGLEELRRFLGAFVDTYRRYGPIIRAWMEDQGGDREIGRLGVRSFTAIASALGLRMDEAGAPHAVDSATSVAALMAMLERFNYVLVSRRIELDDDVMLDSLARLVHRGFFAATPEVTAAG
ncbi:MAG: TetR/AcrR family transcriptional regulator [Actinobacteria bacterium]|nr:TetR/AcrR family transcriptional regulator [Actinomycetota bacterium]